MSRTYGSSVAAGDVLGLLCSVQVALLMDGNAHQLGATITVSGKQCHCIAWRSTRISCWCSCTWGGERSSAQRSARRHVAPLQATFNDAEADGGVTDTSCILSTGAADALATALQVVPPLQPA